MSEDLKPCPFCGKHMAELHDAWTFDQNVQYFYQFQHCRTDGPMTTHPHDAREAWNRRADGWISVAERLPYPGVTVLVAWSDFVTMAYRRRPGGKGKEWYDLRDMAVRTPTHWQPLPVAPKGGDL